MSIHELRLRLPSTDGRAGEQLVRDALELVRSRLGEIQIGGGELSELELSIPWSSASATPQTLAESILRALHDRTTSPSGGGHA